MSKHFAIAIDGPAGAGKTTIAKQLAEQLSYRYVDTGATFRAIAVYMTDHGKTIDDIDEVLNCIDMNIEYNKDGSQRIYVSGEDVNPRLREPAVSMLASDISALPVTREFLIGKWRQIAGERNVVMEGRDTTTVVLPDAEVKIYLDADPFVRARRRFNEYAEKSGHTPNDEGRIEVLADILKRDRQDSTRAVAPLRVAEDAVVIDSSDMAVDDVFNAILYAATRRIPGFIPYPQFDSAVVKARFASVFDDGVTVCSDCKVNLHTRRVFDIEPVDIDGLGSCTDKYIVLENGGQHHVVEYDELEEDDDTSYYR